MIDLQVRELRDAGQIALKTASGHRRQSLDLASTRSALDSARAAGVSRMVLAESEQQLTQVGFMV